MSQVISIRVPEHYDAACVAFQKEIEFSDDNDLSKGTSQKFMISYDDSAYEIQCEGDFPDSVFSALIKVKKQFGGKLFYEGEEWNEKNDEVIEEAGTLNKIWIILAIIFFPITLIFVAIRIFVWVPFKVWKATK